MKRNIVFISLAVLIALGGCSSLNIAVQKMPETALDGVKTIVIDPVMSDRVLPVFPLIDAGMYNAGVNDVRPELLKIDVQKCAELAEAVDAAYRNGFGSETVRKGNPFFKTTMPYDFYDKIADAAKAKIGEVCASAGADLALAYTFRIVTSGVGWFGISGSSYGSMAFYIFDKNGAIIAQGVLQTGSRNAGSKDLGSYALLFNDTKALVPDLFVKMKK
jgi:hypothetical protein